MNDPGDAQLGSGRQERGQELKPLPGAGSGCGGESGASPPLEPVAWQIQLSTSKPCDSGLSTPPPPSPYGQMPSTVSGQKQCRTGAGQSEAGSLVHRPCDLGDTTLSECRRPHPSKVSKKKSPTSQLLGGFVAEQMEDLTCRLTQGGSVSQSLSPFLFWAVRCM